MKKASIKFALLSSTLTVLISTNAFAKSRVLETTFTRNAESLEDPYYQIKKVTVVPLTAEESLELEIEDREMNSKNTGIPTFPALPGTSAPTPSPAQSPSVGGGGGVLDGVIMVVDKLIAIGQKIIPTIEKGKAVVTNNPMSAISVLPRVDATTGVVLEMGGWSLPKTQHFKVNYENGYGMTVVSFVYSVSFQHSGKYKGTGAYLTGIRASARSINVVWGFDVDASSQLIQISNIGTEQNVVAGATIEMAYTVKNWTRQITYYKSFFVSGKGLIMAMDN